MEICELRQNNFTAMRLCILHNMMPKLCEKNKKCKIGNNNKKSLWVFILDIYLNSLDSISIYQIYRPNNPHETNLPNMFQPEPF